MPGNADSRVRAAMDAQAEPDHERRRVFRPNHVATSHHTFTAVWQKNSTNNQKRATTPRTNTTSTRSTTPKTGDDSTAVLFALTACAVASLCSLVWSTRRRRRS